ncbi:hypothetical protein BC939DRAFT_332417 [Gamsiella multidivaricata]|uniref:uncharacterized protein n=1 Tax=Gamsiella multidivaricata TaxID=101098 RepID=UPI00221F8DD8|nr:uncharacterized protein BC939DRAFT_332417 [Gamsiella multidivaricata]KAI7817365.1 hypothetical protein BC939DRAFT_332417 [Gamsiella multidivaricata]
MRHNALKGIFKEQGTIFFEDAIRPFFYFHPSHPSHPSTIHPPIHPYLLEHSDRSGEKSDRSGRYLFLFDELRSEASWQINCLRACAMQARRRLGVNFTARALVSRVTSSSTTPCYIRPPFLFSSNAEREYSAVVCRLSVLECILVRYMSVAFVLFVFYSIKMLVCVDQE